MRPVKRLGKRQKKRRPPQHLCGGLWYSCADTVVEEAPKSLLILYFQFIAYVYNTLNIADKLLNNTNIIIGLHRAA